MDLNKYMETNEATAKSLWELGKMLDVEGSHVLAEKLFFLSSEMYTNLALLKRELENEK